METGLHIAKQTTNMCNLISIEEQLGVVLHWAVFITDIKDCIYRVSLKLLYSYL